VYIPATSRPYLFIPIDGPVSADVLAGPGYTTEIALVADTGAEPADADYHTAQWIGGEPGILIGPGSSYVYATGNYMAYARVTGGGERVVLPAGRVRIGTPPTS
jgi:hypothetical protein